MTNQLPEAGGVAWTTVYKDGVKINLTSRAITPSMAVTNLMAAIEETGATTSLVQSKPIQNEFPNTQAPPQPEVPPDPAWNPAPEPQAVPVTGHDLGLLDRKPNASDLGFGDRFEIEVNEYKYDGASIKFYRTGMEYPDLNHNMTAERPRERFNELFNNWQPIQDDERHPLNPNPIILAIQCTDASKQTKHGNPYQNLDGMRRP